MLLKHFHLKIVSRTLVQASDPPAGFPAVLPVSNLDLVLGSFNVALITVYPAPTAGFAAVAAAVRASLPGFLSRFFPLAGRIVPNPSTNVPELACTNAGAELVLADAPVPLAAVDFTDVDRSLGLTQIPFEQGLALSLQLVRFACGGFSLSWGTNHLLVDGHGLTMLPNAWAELLLTGGLSWSPHHDRSLFRPRTPPRYKPSLDAEFTRYAPGNLINPLLVAALVRRNYVVDAADVDRLRATASRAAPSRPATRLEAFSAHVWKLLAAAVGGSDPNCRLSWLIDGRRRLGAKYNKNQVANYLGNVITYASREATVDEVSSSPLSDVAAMAGAAIAEVFHEERYEELVDWIEAHKGLFKEGGKWTETLGLGLGSPALIITSFLPFRVEGEFGFGRPRLVMPWVRPGRLGSASMTVVRNPRGDGSWVVSARLWPRLAEIVEADAEAVLKPATAARLGFGSREPADVVHASRI